MAMSQKTESEKALEQLHGIGEEHFCVRCCNTVKTKTVSGFSADPFGGNKQVTSPPVCAVCGAGVVKHHVHDMAKLLKAQMQLPDEAKKIDELARSLRRQLDEKNRYIDEMEGRYWHPDTGRIIKRSETALAGAVGRVRIGWQGKVFALTDQGMQDALAYIRQTTARPAYPDLRDEVERLRRENASLRTKLEHAQAANPTTRARRSIEF